MNQKLCMNQKQCLLIYFNILIYIECQTKNQHQLLFQQ